MPGKPFMPPTLLRREFMPLPPPMLLMSELMPPPPPMLLSSELMPLPIELWLVAGGWEPPPMMEFSRELAPVPGKPGKLSLLSSMFHETDYRYRVQCSMKQTIVIEFNVP